MLTNETTNEIRKGSWIQTVSGIAFYPLDPRPEEILVEDIAHALSNQCRFTGHTKEFYSVAQHCVLVSNYCAMQEDALWGLLHDSPEAYLVDLARPIKYSPHLLAYRMFEQNLMDCICKKFNLYTTQKPEAVELADKRMLFTEKRDVLMHPDMNWNTPYQWLHSAYDEPITPWPPKLAKEMFLRSYWSLTSVADAK